MAQSKQGDTVQVHYRGTLKDGSIFDQSSEGNPLEFTIGSGMLIPDFEAAVVGMQQGEEKTINVEAANAYGVYREDMIIEVPRAEFPDHITPQVGQQLQLTQQDGHPLVVTISEVTDSSVTLDANHALAGKDLTFDITLVNIL
ncbi:MAG: peptidylprolyl isomerase [Rhodothermaceae bacterium]|nr:peptidylprolyl isomerase [Rhodothermaceae bacterium]